MKTSKRYGDKKSNTNNAPNNLGNKVNVKRLHQRVSTSLINIDLNPIDKDYNNDNMIMRFNVLYF